MSDSYQARLTRATHKLHEATQELTQLAHELMAQSAHAPQPAMPTIGPPEPQE